MRRKLHIGLLTSVSLAAFVTSARAVTFSLADDFSYTNNSADSVWSYRLDDFADSHPTFPLLSALPAIARVDADEGRPGPD